jgi:hypothetical protein
MSTGAIIAIVVAALIVLAILWLVGRRSRERRLDSRRHEAREIRRDAEVSRAQADRTQAEAEERGARARREEATAREQSARAEEQQQEARDRHLEAASLDPDVDEKEAAERYDRGGVEGITSHGRGENGDGVEHHEQTRTPTEERERHVERDEQGEVVRDEEHREPRT